MRRYLTRNSILWPLFGIVAMTVAIIVAANAYEERIPGVEASASIHDPVSDSYSVEPGKYEVVLPVKVNDLDLIPGEIEASLQPGDSHEFYVVIRQTSEGNVKVELAVKVEVE